MSRNSITNTISWWGDSWTDYNVLSSTNLTDWQEDGIMNGNGNQKGYYAYTTHSPENQKFYRVKFSRVVPHVNIGLDASSPLAELVQILTTAVTPNVLLAVYDVKVINTSATMRSLTITVTTTGANVVNLFTDIKLKTGGLVYSANQIGLPGENGTNVTVVFSDMVISLPADSYVPITILANVSQDMDSSLDGATAMTSINAWGTPASDNQYRHTPDIEDVSNNLVSVEETYAHSSVITFTGADPLISNASATLGPGIVSNNIVVAYPIGFSFSITAGNQTLFVSASPITCTMAVAGVGSIMTLPIEGMSANPDQLSGDSKTSSPTGYYIILAGTTRQFTINGSIANGDSLSGIKSAGIVGINYGTTTANLTEHTLYGGQNLQVKAVF